MEEKETWMKNSANKEVLKEILEIKNSINKKHRGRYHY